MAGAQAALDNIWQGEGTRGSDYLSWQADKAARLAGR